MRYIVILSVATLFVFGQISKAADLTNTEVKVAAATEAEVKTEALTETEVKAAKELYTSKCTKCHAVHPPGDYKKLVWDGWMKKMGRKAKLTPEQFDLVSRYTETLRAADEKKK